MKKKIELSDNSNHLSNMIFGSFKMGHDVVNILKYIIHMVN